MKRTTLLVACMALLGLSSCKEKREGQPQTTTTTIFEPQWVSKAGASPFDFKEDSFLVNDYGAVSDGSRLATEAIQAAIDACAKNGGGTVTFDPGIYLTGSIFLKEGVRFHVNEGVEIRGSENIGDYPEIDTRVAGVEMKWPAALINVLDQKNVSIEGNGLIDGQGKVFWDYYWDLRKNDYEPKGLRWIVDYDAKRPRTILLSNANNVFLKDLNIQRAGFWTVQILYSEFVTADGLTIRNNIGGHGPSTDGIDIDSSRYVLVENCDIDCNDDNFCLKAGRDWDGLRVNRPTEYIVVRNCIARRGAGLLTLGSETSGGIRHVYASNIQGNGTSAGLKIKSATTRGGTVEDILMTNIAMDSVRTFLSISMNWNPSYSYSKLPDGYTYDDVPKHWKKMLNQVEPESKGIPKFRNVTLHNIHVKGAEKAIEVAGLELSVVEDITLNDVHIEAETAGSISYSKNWTLEEVSLTAKDGNSLQMEHVENVNFPVLPPKEGMKE